MRTSSASFGLWYDFRNPASDGATRGFGDFYRATLDQIAWAESIGIDSAWLTEHHFMGRRLHPVTVPPRIRDR